MQIQLAIFLYIYLAFACIWFLFNLIVVFHMFRYGIRSAATFMITFGFVSISALILFYSYAVIARIDWQADFPISAGTLQSGQDIWN